jgi:hypothetical protein
LKRGIPEECSVSGAFAGARTLPAPGNIGLRKRTMDNHQSPTQNTLATIIFGDPEHHTLENRIFNAVVMMGAFAGFCATLLNLYSGNPIRELIITFTATAVPIGCYIASRFFLADKYLRAPLVMIFIGILCIAWITNQGSNGSTLAYFFILFVVMKIILSPPYDKYLLAVSFIAILGLLLLEHLRPELIIPYINASHMFLDKVMSLLICLVVITTLVHLILREYKNERERSEWLYRQTLADRDELVKAFTEIRILQGILPICCFCKKIRDESDQWCTMENYISSHSEAQFSHSFCPDCGKMNYPEQFPNQ